MTKFSVLQPTILGAVLAFAPNMALADQSDAPIGDAINDVPIFDAHIHYKEPAWEEYPVSQIIRFMDESGVAMGLVSSSPDEGTIMMYDYAPNRVVPELRPYHGDATSSTWTKDPDMEGYLKQRLHDHPHEGIGEFHIRNRTMWDEDLFQEIIDMAKADDLFLHVHSGADPIRWLYDLDPDVKIIWAHAGLGEPAREVHRLMTDFPNLMADTSLREHAILSWDNKIDPEWEEIILDFQDRLMIGSDTWINEQWDSYHGIIRMNRVWLSYFPRDVAEKIAYRNAEALFGRKVSMDQIGTR